MIRLLMFRVPQAKLDGQLARTGISRQKQHDRIPLRAEHACLNVDARHPETTHRREHRSTTDIRWRHCSALRRLG
ncbi:MAG TPA: hypothetical protein VHA77_08625 [Xanthobacteraceae bacterium]|nr:hypothetical protein [Xanthobacteraceae bacterium]